MMRKMYVLPGLTVALLLLPAAHGWVTQQAPVWRFSQRSSSCSLTALFAQLKQGSDSAIYSPLFDFQDPEATEKFSRIDDVIMGGVSSSAFVHEPGQDYAKWSGQCREQGGGFCGVRTRPFETALAIPDDAAGLYLQCRLVSDREPERRVWKVSTRNQPDRSEQLYQAMYELPTTNKDEWATVEIPFESFQLVRGPRVVPNGAPLNKTDGLYQIGLTLSKFAMEENVTEIENFRPGFFEYHLKSLGFYYKQKDAAAAEAPTSLPAVLTEKQVKQKSSMMFKILFPIAKLFFSEQSQRRKAALKLLKEKRNLSRFGAIKYGFRNRAASCGVVRAAARLASIMVIDTVRAAFFTVLKIGLVWPIRIIRRIVKLARKPFAKAA